VNFGFLHQALSMIAHAWLRLPREDYPNSDCRLIRMHVVTPLITKLSLDFLLVHSQCLGNSFLDFVTLATNSSSTIIPSTTLELSATATVSQSRTHLAADHLANFSEPDLCV
jgi:hypothetical protein